MSGFINDAHRAAETRRLLGSIANDRGQDVCWYHPADLIALMNVWGIDVPPPEQRGLPCRADFEEGCRKYQETLFGPPPVDLEHKPTPQIADSLGSPHVRYETICGGITRDTLYDAWSRCMNGAQPVFAIINNVTVMEIAKFDGPVPHREQLIEKQTIMHRIDGIPYLITKARDVIKDDQIRFLGDDGCLYVIDFC